MQRDTLGHQRDKRTLPVPKQERDSDSREQEQDGARRWRYDYGDDDDGAGVAWSSWKRSAGGKWDPETECIKQGTWSEWESHQHDDANRQARPIWVGDHGRVAREEDLFGNKCHATDTAPTTTTRTNLSSGSSGPS